MTLQEAQEKIIKMAEYIDKLSDSQDVLGLDRMIARATYRYMTWSVCYEKASRNVPKKRYDYRAARYTEEAKRRIEGAPLGDATREGRIGGFEKELEYEMADSEAKGWRICLDAMEKGLNTMKLFRRHFEVEKVNTN